MVCSDNGKPVRTARLEFNAGECEVGGRFGVVPLDNIGLARLSAKGPERVGDTAPRICAMPGHRKLLKTPHHKVAIVPVQKNRLAYGWLCVNAKLCDGIT